MTVAPASAPLQPSPVDTSFRGALRVLATLLPDASLANAADAPVDQPARPTEPPRTISAVVIEGGALRARRVFDPPEAGIAAFLDGTQQSRTVYCTEDGVPIVHGTVAAVVRERRNSRLYTWRHSVAHRLYAPRGRISSSLWQRLGETGIEVRDTAEGGEEHAAGGHPFALREAAVHGVQEDRERAESELAVQWCEREGRPLLVDGSISGTDRVAAAPCVVGVIKSHHTLYAEGEALRRVLGLRRGERSSVFRITSQKRTTVASWYLRVRDRHGIDPMWGLVRLEVSHPERVDEHEIGARADLVSRWVLAEASPIALPDPRWDTLVYGVRDCEEFLRAIV
ncbi:MAG TPA: hypothetical protein VFJ20_04255 [Gemmatimonadaceae bacterium]|nr:hypothetical protein [Gemmatimonadaceae bacterium]